MGRGFSTFHLGVAIAWTACLGAVDATAQALPESLRIVVPFSPGASNDLFARALAQRLGGKFPNLKVLVDNKPGAGGALGADIVARAKPDGATLLLTSSSFATNAAVQRNLPFDPVASFTPVALLAHGPMVMVVGNATPFASLGDYLAAARDPVRSARLNFGSAGNGSIGHLSGEMLNAMAGSRVQHVPYKGITNAVTDMMGGNLQMMITTVASVNGPLKGGNLRPIAVTSAKRSKFAPELPPIAERVPGYAVEVWWIVLAPAGTPRPIVETLNAEIREWGQTPEMREMYARESTEPSTLAPAEVAAYLATEVALWRKVAKDRNIVLD